MRSIEANFNAFLWKRFPVYVPFSSSSICHSFPGTPCFRGYGRRNGERRRKSVRGCIVSPDLSVLNLVIVKKGENDLPGLTDIEKPRMRGPKRASKIRKLFNLSKEDDVRKYVNTYRRTFTTKSGFFLFLCKFMILSGFRAFIFTSLQKLAILYFIHAPRNSGFLQTYHYLKLGCHPIGGERFSKGFYENSYSAGIHREISLC